MPDYPKTLKRRRLIKQILEERGDLGAYVLLRILREEYGVSSTPPTIYRDLANLTDIQPADADSASLNLIQIVNESIQALVEVAKTATSARDRISAHKAVIDAAKSKQVMLNTIAQANVKKAERGEVKKEGVTSIRFSDE